MRKYSIVFAIWRTLYIHLQNILFKVISLSKVLTNELNFFSSYCQTPNQHITEHSNGTYFIKFFLYFFFFVFFELQLYKEIAFKRVLTSIGVSQKGFVLHIVAFFTTNNIKANTIVLVLAAIKYVACFLEFYFMQTCIY